MKIGVNHIITYKPLLTAGGDYILTAAGEIILIAVRNNFPLRIPIKRACEGYYLRWYYNGWHYWFFLPRKIIRITEGENFNTIGTRKVTMGSGQVTYGQINALRTIKNSKEIQLLSTDGWMNIRIEPGSIIVKNNYINGYEFDLTAIIGSREDYYSPVTDVPDNPSNASKYIYGFEGIYITHHAVTFTMILTGDGDITVYWGDGTIITYTLTDIPLVITHTYIDGITNHTIGIDGEENIEVLDASSNYITEIIIPPTTTSLTTLILDDNELTESPYIPPTVPLIYLVLTNNPLTICEVVIGSQVWMCKNYDSNFPGSKVYDDIEANRSVYGGLYTWIQIVTPGFCPANFHVPTLAEWTTLINFIGTPADAGKKLKEIDYTHWNLAAPPTPGTDNYIFTALPTGYHSVMSGFIGMGYYTKLWTLTEHPTVAVAYAMQIAYNTDAIYNYYEDKQDFCPDSNVYTYVTIGTQQWMIQNLRTTHYGDGTVIPNLILNAAWAADLTGAYCWYDNDGFASDYFLPSRDELSLMKTELYDHGVGNFTEWYYWSSSEYNFNQAYAIYFILGGIPGNYYKSNTIRVRACRAFTSTTVYALRDVGPFGGLIFWKSGNDYLEAAPSDQSISHVWSNIDNIELGITAQGTAIGTGQANSTAIMAQAGHVDSAAKLCDDLIVPITYEYGALYNWYAVNNVHGLAYFKHGGVFEAGWRIPTHADFLALEAFLGANDGGKLKETGLTYWNNPNIGATNQYGFSLRGAGRRNTVGIFVNLKDSAFLWQSTNYDAANGYDSLVYNNADTLDASHYSLKNSGYSIRCMRDVP
jgi:uncharacterized protein (TIGR02145 family)